MLQSLIHCYDARHFMLVGDLEQMTWNELGMQKLGRILLYWR